MSHIVTIKAEVRDGAAVAAACHRLALPAPAMGTAQLYGGQAEGLLVRLPDWLYPIVIDPATGTICYDNYGGCWGDEQHLHRLLQAYVVERARIEARKKNFVASEQSLADGSIVVEIEVGGHA